MNDDESSTGRAREYGRRPIRSRRLVVYAAALASPKNSASARPRSDVATAQYSHSGMTRCQFEMAGLPPTGNTGIG
jgi:hypothetical protein